MKDSHWLGEQEMELVEGSRIQWKADHNKNRGTLDINLLKGK